MANSTKSIKMEKAAAKLYSDVVIIGAGFSGINMACQLQRQLGVSDYTIYDRAWDFGGAWAANKYPGCGVDIPGVFYSLSWFPNPEFTSLFPAQEEILAYVRRVALSHNVPQHIKLRTEWQGAKWIEKTSRWQLYLQDLVTGEKLVHEAKVLISAVGGYTNPKYPSLPGIESFQGKVVHTADWDRPYDLKGLNVAIVGNGCSASQVVPAVIEDVGSVTQFIRSPQHYLPMPLSNPKFTRPWRMLFSSLPFVLTLIRWLVFWVLETSLIQFYDNSSGKRMRMQSLDQSQSYIRKNAPEHYWPLLSPNYDLGCKRRILDNGYIKSLHNPKMLLTKDTIVTVGPNIVQTASGAKYPTDFIIVATGFEFTQWQADTVIGRHGKSMKQHWEDFGGIEAYKTVAMSDFPNLFYLLGPNAGRGHTSVLYSIECSADLVIKIAQPILTRRARSAEVRRDAEQRWCDEIQGALRKTVLTHSCFNHFSDARTGWNFFSYPFTSVSFWIGTRFPRMAHWRYT